MSKLIYGRPIYGLLKCEKCGNRTSFFESAYVDVSQEFSIHDDKIRRNDLDVEDLDWDAFEPDQHYPYEITCKNCGNIVWKARK